MVSIVLQELKLVVNPQWITRGAVKFLSDIFGLEHLNNCIGEITFFKELRSVTDTRSQYSSTFIRNTNIASSRSLSARPTTLLWTSFKSRAAQNPRFEIAAPPLLEKCKAFGPLVNFRRYLVARQQARCQVKSVSQTLGVGLLEHIYTAILDALEDET
ncbi:hypothetical protein M404DRAFT_33082 [Pisolithus tinctorius Marx 270]|uniref:Uncharacterized protein n=1 Tax=Pisolithus tinctorius Marx 270 TaxID=870435 RepID=A0A0C3NMM8_PISTI|nr:hypothetical protein M404DRAFT_33082 [Pisolithus tinctorius Marx 270]